jgi:hypothetical protein
MNPKVLTKYYDQLTARERLTLLVAASVRSDAVERQRLLDSAPKAAYWIRHHHLLAQALLEAATVHLLTLLDVAANFWHWWGLWGWRELKRQRPTIPDQVAPDIADDPEDEEAKVVRTLGMVRYQAYLFVTHREGWRQFCQAWTIEPEALLQIQPGWEMVTRTEAQAREHAYSQEDAAMFLLSEMRLPEDVPDEELEVPQVLTAADLAQVWHTVIDLQVTRHQGKDKF